MRSSGSSTVAIGTASRRALPHAAAVAGTTLRARRPSTPPAATSLRIGLIGCGGRGTGAAAQALSADPNVKLVAMADAFEDRLQKSLAILQKDEKIAGKIDVTPERRFVGFDAYKQVIDCGVDVVLLCTPPHFRPHAPEGRGRGRQARLRREAVAVDAPGVRSRPGDAASRRKTKGLSVVSGLCLRYDNGFRETVQRIHDGAIGDIVALFANDYRRPIWAKPRQPDWTDME